MSNMLLSEGLALLQSFGFTVIERVGTDIHLRCDHLFAAIHSPGYEPSEIDVVHFMGLLVGDEAAISAAFSGFFAGGRPPYDSQVKNAEFQMQFHLNGHEGLARLERGVRAIQSFQALDPLGYPNLGNYYSRDEQGEVIRRSVFDSVN